MDKYNPILDVLQEAARALPYHATKRQGSDEPHYIKKPAASLRSLVITSAALPILNAQGQLASDPKGNMAGEMVPCSTAIANGSRVAEAGASLVFLPEHDAPQIIGPEKVAMLNHPNYPRHFVNVDPALFAEIADDQDTPETARQIHLAPINLDDLRQHSVRVRVNHKEQADRGAEQVANEILASIMAGISRTVDKVFLDTVLATTPEAFALTKAATKGAKIGNLRALVGTAGAGAAIRDDGALTAAGIPAELTAAMSETVVGWFERGAVLLGPDLSILAERLNTNGDLTVTAWFSLNAVLPDSGNFWTVGA